MTTRDPAGTFGRMRASVRVWLGIGCLFASAGCDPSLGECDITTARTVVYNTCGQPAYLGQAIVQESCGYGSYCHSAAATGNDRYGAPAGLNWDVNLAGGEDFDEAAVATLHRGRQNIFENRSLIWTMVESETMPPGGAAQADVEGRDPHPDYRYADMTPVDLGTERDRDALRNWLVCGLPVVERTAPIRGDVMNTEGDTYDLHFVEEECLGEIAPNWVSIYENLIGPWCGQSCHNPRSDFFTRNKLDLSTIDRAYDNMVGVPGAGLGRGGEPACAGTGRNRIEPRNAEESLLFIKLTMTSTTPGACGSRMPLNGPRFLPTSMVPVAEWINAGAPR